MTVAALMDFDPWRDLTPEEWQAVGLSRPRRPPAPGQTFPALPAPPLGVQMVDWARSGQYDERLARGMAPWALPVSVLRGSAPDEAALNAFAKRREYLPAGWTDERDDRTAAGGAFTVTFAPVPPAILPGPLVLMVRLLRPGVVLLGGQPGVVRPLGVSAHTPPEHLKLRRGWHPYLLAAPGRDRAGQLAVDLGPARCSQLLLCVTTPDIETTGED